jgi:SAM-dependent methyltransferase
MENIINKIKDLNSIEILLAIFFILIIISLISQYYKNNTEGFQDINKQIVFKKDIEIYDDFYLEIFNALTYNKIISDFEIGTIINSTNPTEKSIILDIGSQLGYIVNIFKEISPNIIGVELSKNMIDKAIKTYPNIKNNLLQENPLNNQLFNDNNFTHIFCLNHNFYYIQDKTLLLKNCFNWLIPGGYLVLHLLEKPNINISEYIINIRSNLFPQIADVNMLPTNNVKFKDYIYKPNFYMLNKNDGIFEEKFTFNNGNIRKQEKSFYFMPIDTILKIAKYIGYIVLKQYNINNTNNYIYIFYKPN